MSSTGQVPELESLRLRVADLTRELAARDQSMQVQQQSLEHVMQDLRLQSDLLKTIMEGTAADTGDEFLASLATHLTSSLHMQYAVIGEIVDGTPVTIRTVAVASGGALLDNFEYDLTQAPCGTALTESLWCYEEGVQALFPHFPPLATLGVDSHSGVSIRNKQGDVVGLIVVMDTKPITNQERLQALLHVFAPRVAAELQRKHTETALQEQTQCLAHAQALAHLGSWNWEIDSGRMEWSDEQFRIFGHEPGAVATTHETFLAALLPDDHDRVLAAMNVTLVDHAPFDLECRIVRPDGDVRGIHARGEVHRDATGHPIGMDGTVLDITERKQVEDALRASEERWQLAVRGSNDGIWDWNIQAGSIFFSPRWKAMRGYEDDELADALDEWRSRIHPDDLDRVLQSLDRYLAQQSTEFCQEYRVQRKDGSYMWVVNRGVAQWADDGTPLRMVGSETDITARKGVEDVLRESETRFRTMAETAPVMIWMSGCDKLCTYFNQGWLDYTGRTMEQELGSGWAEGVHPDDFARCLKIYEEAFDRRESFRMEYRLHKADGEYGWILDAGTPRWFPNGGFAGYIGSCIDITERKQALLCLAQQESLLRSILDAEPECVKRVAADGTLLQMNKVGLCFIEADSFEQVAGRSVYDLIAPEFLEPFRNMHEAVIQGASQQLEFQIVGLKGLRRWMETHAVPLRNPIDNRVEHLAITRDITERKQTEEKLRFAQFTIDHAVDAVYWINREAKIVDVNEAASLMLGYSKDELRAMTVHDLNPDFHPDMWPVFWAETKQRGTASIEGGHRAKDGRIVPIEIHVSHLSYGENEYHCAFVRNITERKRAEVALRASEERFRTVVESSANGLVMVDGEGRIVLLNRQIERLFGYRREELFGQPIEVLIPHRFRVHHPSLRAAYQKTTETMVPVRGRDLYGMRQDGGEFPVEIGLSPIETGNGPMTLASVMDLTERKRAEDEQKRLITELAESQKHFEHIFHWTPSAVAISTLAEGRFLDVNDRLVQLTGYSREELIGHTTDELQLWADPPERARVIQEILQQRSLHNKEGLLRTKSGDIRVIMVSVDRIEVNATPCLIYVAHDITERKQAETTRARQYEALQAVFRMTVALSRASSLEELYEQGIDGVQRALKVDRASILLFDDDGVMRFKASRGLSKGYKQTAEGHSPWSREAVMPPPICVADIEEDPSVEAYRGILRAEGIRALGFIPLVSSDGLLGKFMLYYDTPHRLTEEEIQVAQTIAGDVALMIQRKQAEDALRQRERELRTVLDALPVGVWCTDATGKVRLTNPAGRRIWAGVQQVGLEGTEGHPGWWEHASFSGEPHRWALARALTKGEATLNEELTVQCLDGTSKVIINSAVPLFGEEGQVSGAIIVNQDITERKALERDRAQTQAFLQSILENIPHIITVKDAKTLKILQVNRAAEQVLGVDRHALAGKTLYDCLPEEEANALWAGDLDVVQRRTLVEVPEHVVKRKGERDRIFRTKKAPILDAEGKPQYILTISEDITDRRQTEEALRQSADRLSLATRAGGVGVWDWDLVQNRLTWDDQMFALYGITRDGFSGTYEDWKAGVLPEDVQQADAEIQMALRGEKDFDTEFRVLWPNGTIRNIRALTTVQRDVSGRLLRMIGMNWDITDRKRLEEALRRREQDLCVAIEERERISQDLHDGILQSLFAVGLGLEASKSTGSVTKRKSADASLDQAIDQLNRVIGEIRNFIEGLGSDPLQGRDLPTSLQHMVASLTQNQPMLVRFAIEDRATRAVSPDHALHVFRVIQEAVSNCIRHGRAQEARVSLKLLKQGVRLSIRDNGCGFNPEFAKGAGHGLINMAARAQKIGGRFTVFSKINKGTRVVFDLPQKAARVHR